MQSYQFSTQEIADLLGSQTLDMQYLHLKRVEDTLQEQIDRFRAHLMRVRKHRSFIEDSMQPAGTVAEMETFGIYRLMMLGDGVTLTPDTQRCAEEWLHFAPITEIGWALPWPGTPEAWTGELSAKIGLLAMPHCVEEHGLCVDAPVYFFPAGHSIRMMVRTKDPFRIRASALYPLKRYAERAGYRVTSDVSGRYSGCAFENSEWVYYFSARVLVVPDERQI